MLMAENVRHGGRNLYPKERKKMKKIMIRMMLVVLFLVVCGSGPVLADGPGFPPLCYPGDQGCPGVFVRVLADGGGFPPLCYPGSQGCPE
jgi:hypothetical protein